MRSSLLLLLTCFIIETAKTQVADTAAASFANLPSKYFQEIGKKSSQLENKITAKSEKALRQFSNQEQKLYKKLYKIDSLAAKEIFGNAKEKINSLSNKLKKAEAVTVSNVGQYIGHLDSLQTSLNFLSQYKDKLPSPEKLKAALGKVNILDSKLQSAEEIKNFMRQRKQQLKEMLSKFGFAKEFKKLNKNVYYYSQQLNEYKEIIKDPKKIEKKAMTMLSKLPAFQQFMKKNSMLAGLFRMPDDGGTAQSLQGLQTRADVQSLIQNRFTGTGVDPQQYIQQQLGAAQAEMNKLKNKVFNAGGGSSEAELPDFKPNNQKTKSFFKRIEFGSNFQTSKNTQYYPVTTDVGLSIGYKLNDKSVIGIGTSYKVGLGSGFNNIKLSSQGVGLRSFIDWKLKGSFFVSGGYELNYRNTFKNLVQLYDYNLWQKSGLVGLSKVVDMKSKFFKKAKVQLLYDFLWKEQLPRGQQLNFRVGYNF